MPDYALFGLRVRSDHVLPELLPASFKEEPEVTIRFGPIDSDQREPGLHPLHDGMVFNVPEAARYQVTGGREILVESEPGAPERNVRLYLFGSAFGALLHQRGLLPLHANAVEIEGRAFAFIGAQGEGKSTLAAWFHDHGHRIVADDICVVRFHDGAPFAMPGLPRLRLWEDALLQTGRSSGDFDRSFVGYDDWKKYDVPVGQDRVAPDPLPFAAAYVLESGEEFDADELHGLEAAKTVFEHTYRGGYLDAAKAKQTHWTAAVALVGHVPIFRLTRRRGFDVYDGQAQRIQQHARSVAERQRND